MVRKITNVSDVLQMLRYKLKKTRKMHDIEVKEADRFWYKHFGAMVIKANVYSRADRCHAEICLLEKLIKEIQSRR